jgi:hypothetical protein
MNSDKGTYSENKIAGVAVERGRAVARDREKDLINLQSDVAVNVLEFHGFKKTTREV